MASPISNWTKEREETLAKLWAEGSSCRQIAAEFGDVSRNAVIGKIHRLGLSQPLIKKPNPTKKLAKQSIGRTIYRIERADRNGSLRVRQTVEREEYKLRCVEIECTTTFEDLTGCRYPAGDGPFLFCNGPRIDGKSYCVAHNALCWIPPAPVKDKAPLREVA